MKLKLFLVLLLLLTVGFAAEDIENAEEGSADEEHGAEPSVTFEPIIVQPGMELLVAVGLLAPLAIILILLFLPSKEHLKHKI